ncbi:MAG: hypothetical protein ACRDBG_25925 [Waterburya sp.]
MATHPLITITQSVQAVNNVATNKINTIYMIGVKGVSGTILDNEIKLIPTVADFNSIVGSASTSAPSYKFLRSLDTGVPIYFVNGKDAGGAPTLLQNLTAGLVALGKNLRLPPGLIISAETGTLAAADITSFYNAAQNLVSNNLLNWEYYHNLSVAANDKTKAITEKTALTSPQGHSSCFYGYGKDSDNNLIPLSVVAAGRSTFLNRNRTGYFSPAAYQEAIPFKTVDAVYLPKWQIGLDEYTELNNANISSIFLEGTDTNPKYTLLGARTLATDPAWKFQNTRYAANNVFNRCVEVMRPFLFLPADISSSTTVDNQPPIGLQESIVNSDVILALQVLLDELKAEGAFSIPPIQDNGNQDEQFQIFPRRLQNGDLAITVEMYLIQTRERIALSFVKKG